MNELVRAINVKHPLYFVVSILLYEIQVVDSSPGGQHVPGSACEEEDATTALDIVGNEWLTVRLILRDDARYFRVSKISIAS